MRRVLGVLLVALVAALALPPLWYAIFPVDEPDLPPAGRSVEIAPGVSVNVLEEGEGSPVVLVHGHPGTAYDWVPFQKTLAALGHRVLAYDRVGYGRSSGRPDGNYTLEQNAAELLALLEVEDLRDVTLVGWSYGGATSIVATRTDPSRISRLALVASIGPGIVEEREVMPPWLFDLIGRPLLGWIVRVPPVLGYLGEGASRAAFAPEPLPASFLELAAANLAMPHTFESVRSESQDLATPGLLDPADVLRPILVVHGDGDLFSPEEIGRGLHERARDAELWIVPGGGHMLPITRARPLAERVAAFAAGS